MTAIEALLLGIVQGLTEFLPISSSGHLELGSFFLDVNPQNNLMFAIVVHGATALSTIVIFRKEIKELISDLFQFRWNEGTRYIWKLFISMIPVGIVGVFFEDTVESFFGGKVLFVAWMLVITGSLLLSTHFVENKGGEISLGKAFVIGIAQAVAILPGISRSGATISTSLLIGVGKEKAARFSFLMVLAPILGAMLLKILDLAGSTGDNIKMDVFALAVGFSAAFASGLVACKWMLKIVQQGKLYYFAIYCFIVAGLVLIFYWR